MVGLGGRNEAGIGQSRSGRSLRQAIAVLVLLSGAGLATSCSLLSGVDDLQTGPCKVGDPARCNGNTPQTCGANGQWQDASAPCGDRTCQSGACIGECEKGQVRCAGDTPQTCSSDGQWESGSPCGNGTTCTAGQCAAGCTQGDLRCAQDTPQVCDANGVWNDSGEPCPPCTACDAALGACQASPAPDCTDPVALAAGDLHTCALLPDGRVKCWGDNQFGQLGLGDTDNRGDIEEEMGSNLPAVQLGPGRKAIAIAAGGYHTCALLSTGSIECWGANDYGQLGLDDTKSRGDKKTDVGNLPTVKLAQGETATAITAGSAHTCALLSTGSVKCWGANGGGMLGLGDKENRGDGPQEMENLPVLELGSGAVAVAITAGGSHTCALLSTGSVKCWGYNKSGQLGLGDTESRGDDPWEKDNLPALELGSGAVVSALSAGGNHTCALFSGGSLKCWGANDFGQLGLGDKNYRGDGFGELVKDLPTVPLGPGASVTAVHAGPFHTCARLSGGSLECWGRNNFGQLGLGHKNDMGDSMDEIGDNVKVVDVGRGRGVTATTAGVFHTCALLSGGTVKCWGGNASGQLGLGDTEPRGDEDQEMGTNLPVVGL